MRFSWRSLPLLAALSLALWCLIDPVESAAQTAPAAPSTAPPTAAAPNAAPANAASQPAPQLTCPPDDTHALSPGALKANVTIDPHTQWQPRGGEVRVTISAKDFQPGNMNLIGCFRWQKATVTSAAGTSSKTKPNPPILPADEFDWKISEQPVRVVDVGMGTITLAVKVPETLPPAPEPWLDRFGTTQGVYTSLYIVPVADLRIISQANEPWSPLDMTVPIGITSLTYSYAIAFVLVFLACVALCLFARWRGVPGTYFPLQIISTKRGYASLSQLQIIMWSFVIGGSAIFVMALSGNLLDISDGTLALLGITGVATVGSKLQSHNDEASSAAGTGNLPGKVGDVSVVMPRTANEIRLSWSEPSGGGAVDTYSVFYQELTAAGAPTGPLICATRTLEKPRFAIVGLKPATAYQIQIVAVNGAGSGAQLAPPFTTTTGPADAAPGAGVPAQVEDVTATRGAAPASIDVAWTAAVGATSYLVEYRVHDSDALWTIDARGTIETTRQLVGLRPNRLYDIRVRAVSTINGDGAASDIVQATSGARIPLWSDLVIDSDGSDEIDVTRVQMLFFTVIAALFVLIKVSTSGTIPEIPANFLLLIGISNGVYLTSKFVPD